MNIQEIQAKETSLQATMATALEAAKVLTPATVEFDEAYGRYLSAKTNLAKIPDELAKAKQAENAGAIVQCGTQIAEAIGQLVVGLKVAELVGTPIIVLNYAVDSEGKALVVFNPIVKIKSTGSKSSTKGAGRTVVVDSQGEKLSLTKFVLEHATDTEKASPEFKYPHTKVDSKPKFEAFCKEHSLTGFTYEVPQAGEVEATPEATPATSQLTAS